MSYEIFETTPLPAPMSYAEVSEGHYLVGGPDDQYDHLVTLGVYTCKAITLHNPDTGHGLLAHLDGTTKMPALLMNMVEAYEEDPCTADIKILQATVHEDKILWPDIESIADFFMRYSPRSLALDKNPHNRVARGIALNLRSGTVHDTDQNNIALSLSRLTLKPSMPLRRLG